MSAPSAQAHFPIRLGLAMWSHNYWQSSLYGSGCKNNERLARYAEVFSTVEGNTTFYATPAATTVKKWHDATPDDFRFTFKLPSTITHQHQLQHCDQLITDFFNVMSPLENKVGLWKVQLPAHFGPQHLAQLATFLERLPKHFPVGVEVRHPAFFAKGEEEKALNQLLIAHHANRIIMDSRPVFAAPPTTDAVIDAHQKKPKVPVHAIATSDSPMVRFIGHPDDLSNDPSLRIGYVAYPNGYKMRSNLICLFILQIIIMPLSLQLACIKNCNSKWLKLTYPMLNYPKQSLIHNFSSSDNFPSLYCRLVEVRG